MARDRTRELKLVDAALRAHPDMTNRNLYAEYQRADGRNGYDWFRGEVAPLRRTLNVESLTTQFGEWLCRADALRAAREDGVPRDVESDLLGDLLDAEMSLDDGGRRQARANAWRTWPSGAVALKKALDSHYEFLASYIARAGFPDEVREALLYAFFAQARCTLAVLTARPDGAAIQDVAAQAVESSDAYIQFLARVGLVP